MVFDFAFYLTAAVVVTGLIWLLDFLCLKKIKRKPKAINWIIETSRSFFPVLLLVWLIRSFVIQPNRVPTGSLEPTVLPGDLIAVTQFTYGLRLPVINKKIIPIREPKRGEIVVFRWPKDPGLILVKRVIGLPGDHIVYRDKILYINGKKMSQKFLHRTYDETDWGYKRLVFVNEENLNGIHHQIYIQPIGGETDNYDLVVPAGHYFMMGDNRDNSDDSRQWGFVPESNLIGRAFVIWMSWDSLRHSIRWHRIGKVLH